MKRTRPIRRGDIVVAALGPVVGAEQTGVRPAIVVSNDAFNNVLPLLTIVPTTRARPTRRVYASEVLIEAGTTGLRSDSIVMTHQIRTIDRARVVRSVGRLGPSDLERVDEALQLHLGLDGAS